MQKRIGFAMAVWAVIVATPADAQKSGGINGKKACSLLSPAEIKKASGGKDVARRPGESHDESQFNSNCLFYGAFDISVHIGNETKVMFGRVRDNYAKAPAKMGYKVEPISGLGDVAYYLTYSAK